MITGFNTDIEHQGIIYHVQTEDKGLDTPLILSLVYDRGTILASKRSPYEDLLSDGFNEKLLAERLQKQHKLMCAAVRAGRIEDLKRMTIKESSLKRQGLVTQKEVKPAPEKKVSQSANEVPPPTILKETSIELKSAPIVENKTETEIPRPTEELIWDIPIDVVEEFIFDGVQIVEEEMILPAEAVEIVSDFAKSERVADDNSLKIELMNETSFKGGERKTLSILLHYGNSEEGLPGAQVLVKIIGSSFRPLIFHAKTDSNGIAIVHLQLPHFKSGRAAVLIKAMSGGEETELRRVVTQG